MGYEMTSHCLESVKFEHYIRSQHNTMAMWSFSLAAAVLGLPLVQVKSKLVEEAKEPLSFWRVYFVCMLIWLYFFQPLQLGDGGQRVFYLNNPGDYEQAWHHCLGQWYPLPKLHKSGAALLRWERNLQTPWFHCSRIRFLESVSVFCIMGSNN